MAPSISQIVAVSYPAVLNKMRTPANQWAESALMREFERQGFIERKDLGEHIECTLDYTPNPEADFSADDMGVVTDLSLKTEVLTAAIYDIAEVTVPIKWSKKDDVKTPTVNQKVPFVKSLLENSITAHDDLFERALFAGTTTGFHGLRTLVPVSGEGVVGGIDAGSEAFWRNYVGVYADENDIEAAMTVAWNRAAKGSGSETVPTLLASDGETQALFEGTQVARQRFIDTQDLKSGFKILAFKTSRYVFSQYGDARIYFLNPKSLSLTVSKSYFRDRGETQEIQNRNAFVSKVYSAGQLITSNKSRLAVIHPATS